MPAITLVLACWMRMAACGPQGSGRDSGASSVAFLPIEQALLIWNATCCDISELTLQAPTD